MAKLVDKSGRVLDEDADILKEVTDFYETLYKKRNVEDGEIADLTHDLPRLSNTDANILEGEISLHEASRALKNMKHSKSPGTDGFTAEFFKFFWNKLGIFVVRSLNCAFRKGELSSVQRQGVVTCIPKSDKSRDLIKNWRPISLLNVVYKIGSACIANRIKLCFLVLSMKIKLGLYLIDILGTTLDLYMT